MPRQFFANQLLHDAPKVPGDNSGLTTPMHPVLSIAYSPYCPDRETGQVDLEFLDFCAASANLAAQSTGRQLVASSHADSSYNNFEPILDRLQVLL